jgi:hypothetical protein
MYDLESSLTPVTLICLFVYTCPVLLFVNVCVGGAALLGSMCRPQCLLSPQSALKRGPRAPKYIGIGKCPEPATCCSGPWLTIWATFPFYHFNLDTLCCFELFWVRPIHLPRLLQPSDQLRVTPPHGTSPHASPRSTTPTTLPYLPPLGSDTP